MTDQIIPKERRFVTIASYCQRTGLSYATVKNGIDTGQIKAIRTKGGYYKIDTQADCNTDTSAIVERLDRQERLLTALCGHLGVMGR